MADLPGFGSLLTDPVVVGILQGLREGVLLLDYDGTLAPFQAERDAAVPYPGVVELLARLPVRGPGRFAVVSGREAGQIVRFLHPATPSEIWGCHGAERLLPGGPPRFEKLTPQWENGLEKALKLAAQAAPADAVETKPVSLALHWRGMDDTQRQTLAQRIRRAWGPVARESGLVLHDFDGGLELRVPGWDKGRAVRRMQRDNPNAALVYLGDDRTDEDAFQAVGPSGLGVLVRARPRATAARYRLTPPGELLRFLSLWVDALGAASTATKEVS